MATGSPTLIAMRLYLLIAILLFPLALSSQVDWEWSWASPLPSGNHFSGAALGESRLVLVGDSGAAVVREENGEWVLGHTGVFDDLHDVVWTGEHFVAVGRNGTIVTSADGLAWTSSSPNVTEFLTSIVWTGTRLIAAGWWGTILTSEDGKQWTVRDSGAALILSDIAWTGDLAVAVGNGGEIVTSPDGINWTVREVPTNVWFRSVIWTGAEIIAAGHREGHHVIARSADGVNWSLEEDQVGMRVAGIAWTGDHFVVTTENHRVWISPDLETWENTAMNLALSSIFWSGTELIATARGGILTSFDGTDWTDHRSGLLRDGHWESISWIRDRWVATGSSGTIATSFDALEWTARETGLTDTITSAAATESLFVAVGMNGVIITSEDGEKWVQQSSPTTKHLTGVAWDGDLLLAVGQGAVMTSGDGMDWTLMSPQGDLMDLVWTGSVFAALSLWGSYATTTDGETWQSGSGVGAGHALAWTGSHLVLVGDGVAVRGDDESWSIANSDGGFFYGVTAGAGDVIAVGARKVWTSTDLKHWRVEPGFDSALGQWFSGGAWNGEKLVLVGYGGIIMIGTPRPFEGERTFSRWSDGMEPGEETATGALIDYALGHVSPDDRFEKKLRPRVGREEGGTVEFHFTRSIHRTDIAFDIRVSDDLKNWTSLARLEATGKWASLAEGAYLTETPIEATGLRRVALGYQPSRDFEHSRALYFHLLIE